MAAREAMNDAHLRATAMSETPAEQSTDLNRDNGHLNDSDDVMNELNQRDYDFSEWEQPHEVLIQVYMELERQNRIHDDKRRALQLFWNNNLDLTTKEHYHRLESLTEVAASEAIGRNTTFATEWRRLVAQFRELEEFQQWQREEARTRGHQGVDDYDWAHGHYEGCVSCFCNEMYGDES